MMQPISAIAPYFDTALAGIVGNAVSCAALAVSI